MGALVTSIDRARSALRAFDLCVFGGIVCVVIGWLIG